MVSNITPPERGEGNVASPELEEFAPFIEKAAQETGMPADILGGMLWQESRGNPNVAGGGLMQIGPHEFEAQKAAHPDLIRGDVTDPASNIMAAAFYLKSLGGDDNLPLALRKYNSGPEGADPSDLRATPAGSGDPAYIDLVQSHAQKIDAGEALPP
jgi:soluble lytic murein transglycosylase-like protein